MRSRIGLVLFSVCLVTMFLSPVYAAAAKGGTTVPVVAAPVVPTTVATPVPVVAPVTVAPQPKKFAAEVGFGGGAGLVNVGYVIPFPKNQALSCKLDAGLALGNAYNIMLLQGQLEYAFNPQYFGGLSLDWANYSDTVGNISGISGNIAKGAHIGGGLFVGKVMDQYNLKLGYSTVLGLVATIGTKF